MAKTPQFRSPWYRLGGVEAMTVKRCDLEALIEAAKDAHSAMGADWAGLAGSDTQKALLAALAPFAEGLENYNRRPEPNRDGALA